MKTEGEGGEALAESYELIGRILARLVLGGLRRQDDLRFVERPSLVHAKLDRHPGKRLRAHVEKGLGNVAGGVQHPVSFVLGLPQAVFCE
ncbi:msr2834 [Mesorhizobium japonicum MAFF 303099]|uniref:Msr2834 protein n=1 Tax=Mesorhizobium japonicum (strain LMG 29417 / CECT 9101 / MAFF 303099) TaxID=266835 RepID=Q98HK4_RHILO|nr:msr2834 [Mesorhizobium japonicum MAFF 303099]